MRQPRRELLRCAGAKGSIIMVAGACGKVSDWDGQLPLAESYDVLRYAISGDSEKDARELIGLCREAGLKAPNLLGHSLGSIACGSFCHMAARGGNEAFRPRTLALVCPVGIPQGSPAGRVLLMFQKEGAAGILPEAAREGMDCETAVMLVDGHFPFRDRPAWFNREYGDFIRERPPHGCKGGAGKP